MLGCQNPLNLRIQQSPNRLLQLLWYGHRKTRYGIWLHGVDRGGGQQKKANHARLAFLLCISGCFPVFSGEYAVRTSAASTRRRTARNGKPLR